MEKPEGSWHTNLSAQGASIHTNQDSKREGQEEQHSPIFLTSPSNDQGPQPLKRSSSNAGIERPHSANYGIPNARPILSDRVKTPTAQQGNPDASASLSEPRQDADSYSWQPPDMSDYPGFSRPANYGPYAFGHHGQGLRQYPTQGPYPTFSQISPDLRRAYRSRDGGTRRKRLRSNMTKMVERGGLRRRALVDTNDLIVKVSGQSTYAILDAHWFRSSEQLWPEKSEEIDSGVIRVHRTRAPIRFKLPSGQFTTKLPSYHGPVPSEDMKEPIMQWLHIQTDRMNLKTVEDVSLRAPGINAELKYVVSQLFKQIRERHQKRLFDGPSLDHGAVLRCNGDNDHSAVFLSFPYMALRVPQSRDANHVDGDHPVRSILQVLYPYESTLGRDTPPAFCQDLPKAQQQLLCVPQLWAVIIGSKHLVTCSEVDIATVQGPLVKLEDNPTILNLGLSASVDWNLSPTSSLIVPQSPDEENSTTSNANHQEQRNYVQPSQPDTPSEFPIVTTTPDAPQFNMSIAQAHGPSSTMSPWEFTGNNQDEAQLHTEEKHDLDARAPTPKVDLQGIENAFVSMLSPLLQPQYSLHYFESLLRAFEAVLPLLQHLQTTGNLESVDMITTLEQAIHSAELLKGLCELEVQHKTFVNKPNERDALVRMLGSRKPTFTEEFGSLQQAVQESIDFFSGAPGHEDTDSEEGSAVHMQSSEPEVTSRRNSIAFSTTSTDLQEEEEQNVEPPFLAWAFHDTDVESRLPLKRLAMENLMTIMEHVNRKIRRHEKIYSTCNTETNLQDLEVEISLLGHGQGIEGTGRQSKNTRSNAESEYSSSLSSRSSSSASKKDVHNLRESTQRSDRIIDGQEEATQEALQGLVKVTKEFIRLFVPINDDHLVVRRVWGAVHSILEDIRASQNAGDRSIESPCIIRPLEQSLMTVYNVELPGTPIETCFVCLRGTRYNSLEDAIAHLKTYHFHNPSSLSQKIAYLRGDYHHWIRSEEQLRTETHNEQRLRLLRTCLATLKTFVDKARELHRGAFNTRNKSAAIFQLPEDLIECFETMVLVVMQTAASTTAIKAHMRQWQYTLGATMDYLQLPLVSRTLARLARLGKTAQSTMARAERTLSRASWSVSIASGPAGPELLLAIICQNLQGRHVLQAIDMDIEELYQSYTSKLQYRINKFPRKRLLRDIHGLQEELSVVKSVNEWQQKAYRDYLKVLDHQSFENPSTERVAMFPAEKDCVEHSLTTLRSKAMELDALASRTGHLREQLKQSVEILEEDHGKAILVFTMITTIFLPLSFITSLFGMNTIDIRDTNRTQSFFWAVAVPVTAGIIIMAVFFAYRGDQLYDALVNAYTKVRRKSSSAIPTPDDFVVTRNSWQPLDTQSRRWWKRRDR